MSGHEYTLRRLQGTSVHARPDKAVQKASVDLANGFPEVSHPLTLESSL